MNGVTTTFGSGETEFVGGRIPGYTCTRYPGMEHSCNRAKSEQEQLQAAFGTQRSFKFPRSSGLSAITALRRPGKRPNPGHI
eukprot:66697-Rhodomonas_salina.3